MPTNLYGPGDNYHPSNGHVMAALISRFANAVSHNLSEVSCWGVDRHLENLCMLMI